MSIHRLIRPFPSIDKRVQDRASWHVRKRNFNLSMSIFWVVCGQIMKYLFNRVKMLSMFSICFKWWYNNDGGSDSEPGSRT